MSKPLFVAITDTHYGLNNKELADTAWRSAIDKAAALGVPLIDMGDITNDKAIIRAEVANMLIATMKYANSLGIRPYLLVGNHSLVNEKGSENAIAFLAPYVNLIDTTQITFMGDPVGQPIGLIPYQSSTGAFRKALRVMPWDCIVICHQGVQGAFMGDYSQDKTSIEPEALKGHRIYSGHYHKYQTVGTLTYGGSPFTHTFGEANDGPKGYLIVHDDGSHERVILDLRKHVKLEAILEDGKVSYPSDIYDLEPYDLLWTKIQGPKSELDKMNKDDIGKFLIGHSNFKLDLIPTSLNQTDESMKKIKLDTAEDVLDSLIESSGETPKQIKTLKKLWRDLV